MSLDADQMYALLPAVYRAKDAASGGQLRALFEVLAAQSDIVAQNIGQLYDDEFIETCEPWVIPYIGDLVGYNSLYELAAVTDTRAEVANTIGYRRRKGTKIALQQVAIDVSGRAAVIVEEFQRLITMQSMRNVRLGNLATVDLRDRQAMRLLGGAASNGIVDSPFDLASRTIDVRRIAPRARDVTCDSYGGVLPDSTPLDIALHGPGRANIPDVAIHLWRLQTFRVTKAPAFVVGGGRYKFSPLGNDMALFSPLNLPLSFSALLRRDNVPAPIARAELAGFYASGTISLLADGTAVDASQVLAANLADRPGGSWCTVPTGMIAIDPELGRIQFAADVALPDSLEVSYWYGFPAPIGGGGWPYDRTASLAGVQPGGAGAGVATGGRGSAGFFAIVGSAAFPTLESAVAGWNVLAGDAGTPSPAGTIVLQGFASLNVNVTGTDAIQLPAGSNLVIAAGQLAPPSGLDAGSGNRALTWDNAVVTITGNIEVTGLASAVSTTGTTPPGGQLLISGIWLAGRLLVSGGPSFVLVSDSTVVPGHGLLSDGTPLHPGEPSIVVTADGASLVLTRAITGPIAAAESGTTRISGSIVDATSPYYVAHAGPDLASAAADLRVEDSTVVGKVRARTITCASNSIFHARLGDRDPWPAPVWAGRLQSGCVRFCFLPAASLAPRRYECLPPGQASEPPLWPEFVTTRYGRAGYLLLSGDCPVAVWTGADNGSQLGVYLQAQETEAVRNVQVRAPEYLPARLECGVFLHPAREVPPELPLIGGYYGRQGYGFTGIGAELV